MLLRLVRLQTLPLKPNFYARLSLSLCTAPHPGTSNDTISNVSALIHKPDWQKNVRLKALASHLNPHSVSRIITFHGRDIPLCVDFFKWVCKQSTYCYDTESRIQVLYLLATDNLYGVMHKVVVWLIRESCISQDDFLKIIVAIQDMREKYGFRINYPCYSALLMCLAKLDMGSTAFLVFRSMLEDGFVASGIDYRNVVNALCKNGFVQAAEMFLSRVLKLGFSLDVYFYTSLVLGNCRADEVGEALKVFALMSEEDGCGVNSVTYSILIHGLCEAGRLDEALKLKDEMCVKGCQPSVRTYTVLIKAMSDKGLTDETFGLLDEMIKKGCKPNVHTYTVLVDMLCREGKIEEANGMFRKMLKDGLNPSTVTYNALINCYCKEGRVVSAFELLGVMERRQCKPNIRTYNELMEGLCIIGRPYKAMALLRHVINNGLFPTLVTFNILIVGFCRVGELNTAIKILNCMSLIGIAPDEFTYTAFADKLCKMERLELAGVFLVPMMKKGISLDEVTLTSLIHGYCKNGETRNALLLLEEIVRDGCLKCPHFFNIFLDALGKDFKVAEQNAMLGKMLKLGLIPSVVTYTIMVDGLCRVGDTDASMKMIELMKTADCPPNIYTYAIVIDALCRNGKLYDAENLLVEMQKTAVLPNRVVYALLIESNVATGRLDHAFEIAHEMFLNHCEANNQIYSALLAGMMTEKECSCLNVNSLFTEMDIDHAFKLLGRIRDCGGNPFDVYKFLITGLCRTGRISEADILIQEMVKNGLTPDSDICACVIKHFCRSEDYALCLEWIRRFAGYSSAPSFASYNTVIAGLQDEGRFQEADWLIADLLRSAGVDDHTAISPYVDFLVEGEGSYQVFELLKLMEQRGHNERPIL